MKQLLLATATLFALSTVSHAAVVGDLGVNPTSSQGAFNNGNLPTGTFADQWTFQLQGTQFITIGSATNDYPQVSDFITNFNGSVYDIVGAIDAVPGSGDDILVLGPAFAVPGNCSPGCQTFGGSAILNAGDYYLNIAGSAGSTAGYGGNLAVAQISGVPEPATWMMLVLGFLGIGTLALRRKSQLRLA